MSDVSTATEEALPQGPTEVFPTHVAGGDQPLSVDEAARSLTDWRRKGRGAETNSGNGAAEPAATAPAAESDAAIAADDAAPPPEVPGETEQADPAAEPPIDPPRSWTKDEKERFRALPRETQEYLAQREQERDQEFRRRQNEAAESRKAVEAERDAAAKARTQYETALPQLVGLMERDIAGEFADIRSQADVAKLVETDLPRFLKYQARQQQLTQMIGEMQAVQGRVQTEKSEKFSLFAKAQDELFNQAVPDAKQRSELQDRAMTVLSDLGFSNDELTNAWNGGEFSLRDHRVQLLIRDAVRYRDAQEAARKVTARPLPPVQKPGVTRTGNSGVAEQIAALSKQMDTATGLKQIEIGAEITKLRRSAGQRS